ncbi:hypothetical protein DFH94DRAFT_844438 [Russula ochroleuca]|uniref:Uncharacterized protein n=1 Tax=Russula ochroleuca TaxID=152965 RepID=A0A9P5T9M4_9AGAM|nr:hypothetical protein DFH94DRAFT_844438 [Russula ochroleuca]
MSIKCGKKPGPGASMVGVTRAGVTGSLALGEEDEKDKSVIASLNHIAAKFAQVQGFELSWVRASEVTVPTVLTFLPNRDAFSHTGLAAGAPELLRKPTKVSLVLSQ